MALIFMLKPILLLNSSRTVVIKLQGRYRQNKENIYKTGNFFRKLSLDGMMYGNVLKKLTKKNHINRPLEKNHDCLA